MPPWQTDTYTHIAIIKVISQLHDICVTSNIKFAISKIKLSQINVHPQSNKNVFKCFVIMTTTTTRQPTHVTYVTFINFVRFTFYNILSSNCVCVTCERNAKRWTL